MLALLELTGELGPCALRLLQPHQVCAAGRTQESESM
jgi:hypothetical protein